MIVAARLALCALLALAGCAPASPPPPAGTPALWLVEDKRGAPAAWLFGTIHALPKDVRWQGPALDRAIASAGVLVVEVRDLDPGRLAARFAKVARDEPVPPLAARVDPAQRPVLARLLNRDAHKARALDSFETWAAALTLAPNSPGLSAQEGADRVLLAQFDPTRVIELEGARGQLALFDNLPERDQRALLKAVLAEAADPDTAPRALADAWLAGDLTRIERAARRGLLADPALERALASGRNGAWMRTIVPLIADGRRPLVAVGTAHMLGPSGLPTLLAQHGFTVRRLQ